MSASGPHRKPICRSVGDPIDVVTGANYFELLDFRLVGPLPLLWSRTYNSRLANRRLALGWGHTHGFDQALTADLDGIRYTNQLGDPIGFPPLESDGDTAVADGLILERLSASIFALHDQSKPTLEFAFVAGQPFAPLTALRRGDDSIRLEYQNGLLRGLVDSLGRYIAVKRDSIGRLTGLVLSWAGKGQDRVLLDYVYNDQHDLIEATDPSHARTRYRYDVRHRMVARADRRGYSFRYEYDDEGRCTHSGGEDGMQEVRLCYDPLVGLTEVTWLKGGKWQYFYDSNGAVTKVVDPYGGLYSFAYDDSGRLVQEVDPNRNIHSISYDDTGAPIESPIYTSRLVGPPPFYDLADEDDSYRVAENPLEWEFGEYLSRPPLEPFDFGAAAKSLSPKIQGLVRPSLALPYSESANEPGCIQPEPSPLGATACMRGECECDDFGLAFHSNQHGSIHLEKFADETYRRWKYDPNGCILAYTDREGHRSSYEYTSWDQLARYTDSLGRAIEYQRDSREELILVRDPGGTESRYEYDLKNRLTHVYRQGALKEEYRYDGADNLIRKLDGQGRTLLSIDIGDKNREAAVHFASGEKQEFAYDEQGRIIRATSQHCELLREYDESGRVLADSQNGPSVQREPDDDDTGGEKLTLLGRFTFVYSDDDGALVIKDPAGNLHTLRTFPGGLVQRRMGNGTEETAQFDQSGHCLFKATCGSDLSRRTWIREYIYSPEGDLTAVRDNQRGEDRYTYDAAHRLIESNGVSGARLQFRRDAADNLLTHPELDSAVIADRNRLASAGLETFHYNERHDLMLRDQPGERIVYDYDSFDQLQRVRSRAGETRFTYDPLGRRLTKTHNGRVSRYHWDGDRLAAEIDPTGRVRVYAYPDELALVPLLWIEYDSLDADPATGRAFYVFTDQIGTPIRVEDGHGEAVWSARISPYGAARIGTGEDFFMPLRWPGHYYDEETGLHYNRYRYYDPRLGRYIQSDPDGVAGGLNLYAYASNPLTEVDVLGLAKCCNGKKKCPKKGRPRSESTKKRKKSKHKVWKIKDKFPPGSPKSRQLRRFVKAWNDEIAKAGGQMRRRKLSLRQERASNAWKKKMRKEQPERFKGKVVGHTPDAAAGGPVAGGRAMALDDDVNSTVGGSVGRKPVGYTYNEVQVKR